MSNSNLDFNLIGIVIKGNDIAHLQRELGLVMIHELGPGFYQFRIPLSGILLCWLVVSYSCPCEVNKLVRYSTQKYTSHL